MLPLFPGEDMSLRPESPQMDIMYSAASNLNISLKFLEIYASVIMQRKQKKKKYEEAYINQAHETFNSLMDQVLI